jgi:hypothetical protein
VRSDVNASAFQETQRHKLAIFRNKDQDLLYNCTSLLSGSGVLCSRNASNRPVGNAITALTERPPKFVREMAN